MIKQVVLTILKEHNFDGYGEIEISKTEKAIFLFHKTGFKYEFYLIIEMQQKEFIDFDENELFSRINEAVRKSSLYVPEVDKNTSLIICVEKDPESKDEGALEGKELAVEENPYFYKKYVLSYDLKVAKDLFENYLSLYNNDSKITEFISDIINDFQKFTDFKLNAINNEDYALLSKIFMKIPIIPVEVPNNHWIKPLSEVVNEAIISEKLRKPEALVKLLNDDKIKENLLDENITSIIECWEGSNLNG